MPGAVRVTTYREFRDRLSDKAAGRRIPVFGGLDVTRRCNMRCSHCYVRCEEQPLGEDLSYEQICGILDEVASAGCLWITLTGGEPFVRSDFLDIYRHAKSKGFLVTVYTNGTLIDSNVVACLAESMPYMVEVSAYGATAETYEGITNRPGSFEAFMSGIRLLHDAGIPLLLKTPLLSVNVRELPDIEALAESLGVELMCDTYVIPRLNRDADPVSLRMPIEQAASLRRRLMGRLDPSCLPRPGDPAASSDDLFTCLAGKRSFHISAEGYLEICPVYRTSEFRLLEAPFLEGWNRYIPTLVDRKLGADHKCRRCRLRPVCALCPAKAKLETGDDEGVVDYYCQAAELLAAELGWDAPEATAPAAGTSRRISQPAPQVTPPVAGERRGT